MVDSSTLDFALKRIKEVGKHHVDRNPDFVRHLMRAADEAHGGADPRELIYMLGLRDYPVSVEEFLFSPDYLNRPREEMYDDVVESLININNPDDRRIVNRYTEAVLTGGIGSAKTTTALYTQAYQLYVLSCFRDPHATFGLDSTTEIVFVFQSMSNTLARSVDYERFRMILKDSYYFTKVFPNQPRIISELRFPHRIYVKPVGTDDGAIGQNVISGLIDEINFMAVIENSKKAADRGTYNQALTVYNSISRRRKSRFIAQGSMPGILCLVSSKRYPGEFTDQKIEEAKTDPTIFVYDKRVWDVKPKGTFTQGYFRLFTGTTHYKARILKEGEVLANDLEQYVIEVPTDYRREFENDMIGSLRDIAGVSTMARYPFMSNTKAVAENFGNRKSVLNLDETDMETTDVVFYPKRFENHEADRWVHVDLGLSSDSAGITCGWVSEFVPSAHNPEQMMPRIEIDFILRVKPPMNGEIKFHKIRALLSKLRDYGLPIRWVSFDSYQSADSVQLLRQQGFMTGIRSMDKTLMPYSILKTALYDRRVPMPEHEKCQEELLSLELLATVGKVDHPPQGSKDCADSLCGVVYGLTTRREIWARHGVPFSMVLPDVQEPKHEGKL